MSASATIYRGFRVHLDPDGVYAETDGGTCLGPFDSFEQMCEGVDRDLRSWPDHGEALRLERLVAAMEWGFRASEKGWNLDRATAAFRITIK